MHESTCKSDSLDWQFRSFQHCATKLLDVTVVNIMEVVSSLQGESTKRMKVRTSGKHDGALLMNVLTLCVNYRPGGVNLIDVVDHVAGKGFKAGPGEDHHQASSQ